VRFSDDNGATLELAGPGQRRHRVENSQFWGRLAIDQTTGDIALSWYDCRNDIAARGRSRRHAQHRYRVLRHPDFDGGRHVQPNFQIAGGPSSAIANPNSGNDYGDYTGLAPCRHHGPRPWADTPTATA